MSIQQPSKILSTTLLTEIASRVTLLTRTVTDNGSGTISTVFGATIIPQSITYEVDANSKPTAIYETSELPSFDLTEAQLNAIYSLQVTPAGATAPMALGDVLAAAIDQVLVASGVTGTVNTTGVTLPTA